MVQRESGGSGVGLQWQALEHPLTAVFVGKSRTINTTYCRRNRSQSDAECESSDNRSSGRLNWNRRREIPFAWSMHQVYSIQIVAMKKRSYS
jgi:hypothetical protein